MQTLIRRKLYRFFLPLFLFTGCYEEHIVYPDPGSDFFNFIVTDEQESFIYSTRSRAFIENPLPSLNFGDATYGVDRFEIRGASSLNFRRKSWSVDLDDNIFLFVDSENKAREFEEFKLVSLVFDYTYIEHSIAIGLCRILDLWPTHSEFTEVRLNNNTQGLYLFIEDPQEYFMYQRDASFILRRYYDHIVENYHLNEFRTTPQPEQVYLARFDSIYSYIGRYTGEALYDSLMTLLDLPQYFTKIALDMFLQNGDYTDEIFFYTRSEGDREIFGIYPWDYDDLFAVRPHEIGRNWAPGTVFGTRHYSSMDDIIADVGVKLIYSIEDDLDYKIAKDEYIYARYVDVLEDMMMNKITDATIEDIILHTRDEIQPYYNIDEIIAQSVYDQDETNRQLLDENLADKRKFLLDRRNWILQELPKHKSP